MNEKQENNKELSEYLKWRAEDNNKALPILITWFCVLIVVVLLCILSLYVWGVLPHGESTTVCTTTKIVSGLIA